MITITKAKAFDIPHILEIVEDARQLINKQNFKQWSKESNYPNHEVFLKDINNDALYVIKENEQILGMMAIYTGEDINYDYIEGKWLSDTTNYLTIHRLAIRASHYQKGLAKSLFEFAIDYAKENKLASVRIDTHPKNINMNNLAKKLNFTYCGTIYIKGERIEPSRNAYERVI